MLDTGLIAAQVAFLLLLYLFVWRVVRSSSKSIDPLAGHRPQRNAPPVATPVEAAGPAPERPSSPAPAPAPGSPGPGMPAVVRVPPPAAADEARVAAPAPSRRDENVERHPPLDAPAVSARADGSPEDGPQAPGPEGAESGEPAEVAAPGAHEPASGPGSQTGPDSDRNGDGDPAEPEADPGPADGEPSAPEIAAAGATPAAAESTSNAADTGSGRRPHWDTGVIDLGSLAPKLVVEDSPALAAGVEIDLAGGLTIGRSASSDFTVDDPYVSHMHARILRRGAYHFVEDLGSTNGTFLNDHEVERDARLKVRDTLRIGQTLLRYEE